MTRPGSLAIIVLVCAQYTVRLFSASGEPEQWTVQLASSLLLLALVAVNATSVHLATWLQSSTTAFKVLALVLIAGIGLVALAAGPGGPDSPAAQNFERPFEGKGTSFKSFGVAVMAALWGFDGWSNLNMVTEEVIAPERTLPRATILASTIATLSYVLANVAYLALLHQDQIVDFNASLPVEGFVSQFGAAAFGDAGEWVLPLFIAVSTFGAANGSLFSGARLLQKAAENGDLPAALAVLHGTAHPVPARATAVQGVLGLLLVLLGDFESLLTYFSVAAWIFYMLAVSSLFLLRRREPKLPRPFKAWLPIPILFCAIAFTLATATTLQSPVESLVAIGFILSAYPVYWLKSRLGGGAGPRGGAMFQRLVNETDFDDFEDTVL